MKSLQVNNLQPMYYNENSPGLQYMEYFPQQKPFFQFNRHIRAKYFYGGNLNIFLFY